MTNYQSIKMATTNMRIMVRRDSRENWAANGGVQLLEGEMAFEFNNDSGFMRAERFKVGDGLDTKYEDLPYFQMGITGIDEKTLVKDANGRVYLADSVLGMGGDTISVKDYVDGEIAKLEAASEASDSALGVRIDEAIADYTSRDTALGARIDAEILDRYNADTALGARIDTVAAAFAAADSLLGDRIDSLTDTVVGILAEDSSLGARIDTLGAASDAADAALGVRIDTVEAAYVAADSLLSTRLDTLDAASSAGDVALGGRLDTLDGASSAADDALAVRLDTVASAFVAADSALANRIDTIQPVVEANQTRGQINEAEIAILKDTTDSLLARIDTVDAALDTKADDDVGTGKLFVSNNNTLAEAIGELGVELNRRAKSSDTVDVVFQNVVATSYSGNLNGKVFFSDGSTACLDNNVSGASFDGGIVGVVDATIVEDLTSTSSDVQDDITNGNTSVDTAIADLKAAIIELQTELAALAASLKV